MKIAFHYHILPVEIGEYTFTIDADDIHLHQAISDFMDTYRGNRIVSDVFLRDCKNLIDLLLGEGTYTKIFHKDDLKPYYAILQLADAMKEHFEENATTEQMRKRQILAEQEMKNMQTLVNDMSEFTKQLEYNKNTYQAKGMTQHVANKQRSSNRNRNRQK